MEAFRLSGADLGQDGKPLLFSWARSSVLEPAHRCRLDQIEAARPSLDFLDKHKQM